MKEWNELLVYIDEYVYIQEDEEIVIRYSARADKAIRVYDKGLKLAGEGEYGKWLYDIALDCVRRMSREDLEYVKKHLFSNEYHFGYAMGIRNKYIHPSKKHSYFSADNVSSSIMTRIFSLVSPFYDFRNARCVRFFESNEVNHLMELYGESHADIINEFISEITSEIILSDNGNDTEQFKKRLREELGQEEFVRLFKEAYLYYNEKEKQNERDDWYWNTNFPEVKAILFPLEAKQIIALRQLNYFRYIESGTAKTIADCRKFIDENLGLRDDYADFMARCGWEACSPYFNGTWGNMKLYVLDLDYVLRMKLRQQNIETIGELCKRSPEDLLEIQSITTEDAMKIHDVLTKWLEERNIIKK